MPDSTCLHVNCGGNDITVKENKESILYLGDGGVEGGAAENFFNDDHYWGFSSTGDFLDDNDFQNTRYSVSVASSNQSELYTTARIAPISITYFHYCLENGDYTLSLHFAEIQFTNNQTFTSLGRRIFDIYIQVASYVVEYVSLKEQRDLMLRTLSQDKLWWKDFNIEDQAKLAQTPVVLQQNISVTNNVLEIRFYFAGKGTTRIPDRGVYGPLVSAISVKSGESFNYLQRMSRTEFAFNPCRMVLYEASSEHFSTSSTLFLIIFHFVVMFLFFIFVSSYLGKANL